jgi:hypothetical protein
MSDSEYLTRIRGLLMSEWDPIGIKHVPQCRDEYDAYALSVCRLVARGASANDIARYLASVEVEDMRLSSRPSDALRELAAKLINASRCI